MFYEKYIGMNNFLRLWENEAYAEHEKVESNKGVEIWNNVKEGLPVVGNEMMRKCI